MLEKASEQIEGPTVMMVIKRWHGMREWNGGRSSVGVGDFILGRWGYRFGIRVGLAFLKDCRKMDVAKRYSHRDKHQLTVRAPNEEPSKSQSTPHC